MEKRHYSDYFYVPSNYRANMTREAINVTPETWLDFYPHPKYIDFLRTLFEESKSVWLTGNYGTGKSNAALVTHKLFMDDIERVDAWFDEYSSVIVNCADVKKQLLKARNEKTVVIYDYNASGIGPNEEFLVRLEKGIIAALKERDYIVPTEANIDTVIERLRREGVNFFKTRDSIIDEMRSLKKDISSVEQLINKLREEGNSSYEVTAPTHYLDDVQTVFHKDNIYLNVNVTTFRNWIGRICKANGIKRIIYIFDEFSDFIDANSGQLKTFEDVTETPDVNHFYLVPVTHKELVAFYGENSPGANKAKDRFYFRNLQMPNDIAFKLAAQAMKPIKTEPIATEWANEKDSLWNSVSSVVDKFDDPETSEAFVSRQSFYDILPIQPMAAFLLKFLAESARSNQRSVFEYLKGSADGREFLDFISKGGPRITGKQFLTADYLWKYFMEREDSGVAREIVGIKAEYDRIKNREFANYGDEQPEIRILKTVMLFTLLSRLNTDGHVRLRPTVENVELSFRGDGSIVNVETYLRDMAENRHCFSIANGVIDLYSSTVGDGLIDKKKQELENKFHELLSEKCRDEISAFTKLARGGFSNERFDIRCSDASHTTLSNITSATRDKYSTGINKDDGSVCLWFVIAKNKSDQMQIQDKQDKLLQDLTDHRIVMFSFPDITFCEDNTNLWNEYIGLHARYLLENNKNSKDQIQTTISRIEDGWIKKIKKSDTAIIVKYYDKANHQIITERKTFTDLKQFLVNYIKTHLECCPDIVSDQITVYENKALKSWALAGLRFKSSVSKEAQLIQNLSKEQLISPSDEWFIGNPNHLFSKIRSLMQKKYDNTVSRGTELSLRKVFLELKRAPYGMRYNGLSAFSLGFCTRWILENNCQWTNGQMNYPLDEDTLAEIIESAVSEKTDKEKFICRLSKADKCFAEQAGCLFGLPKKENATPLETLRDIATRIEGISNKVPLWALADFIRESYPEHEFIAKCFDTLCVALRSSSKGDTAERSSAISEVGQAIIDCPEIIMLSGQYVKADVFVSAFRQYVDRTDKELSELAGRVNDHGHEYCDLILNQARTTTGWLWNRADITTLIAQTNKAYHFMEKAYAFMNITEFISYEETKRRLLERIIRIGLPISLLGEKSPAIEKLAKELLMENGNSGVLFHELDAGYKLLDDICNDPKREIVISLVKNHLSGIGCTDDMLRTVINDVASDRSFMFDMATETYIKLLRNKIEQSARSILIRKCSGECERICGCGNIQDWSYESHLPAWTLFAELENGRDILTALMKPNDCTNDFLQRAYVSLESMPIVDMSRCQKLFLNHVIPQKYKELGIGLPPLLKHLSEKYGKDPNKWPENPDVNTFILEQYRGVLAPNIVSKLRLINAERIKEEIVRLAKEDPDIGLRLLEL